MSSRGMRAIAAMGLFTFCTLLMAAGSNWIHKVPAKDRDRTNPYAGQPGAAAAGGLLYRDHCAKCHGDDALGRRGRPSLRGVEVEHATDGELFWLLRNGSTWKGMPSWSSLPEPQRWQVITYLRSLPPDSESTGISSTGAQRP